MSNPSHKSAARIHEQWAKHKAEERKWVCPRIEAPAEPKPLLTGQQQAD